MEIEVSKEILDEIRSVVMDNEFSQLLLSKTTQFASAAIIMDTLLNKMDTLLNKIDEIEKQLGEENE